MLPAHHSPGPRDEPGIKQRELRSIEEVDEALLVVVGGEAEMRQAPLHLRQRYHCLDLDGRGAGDEAANSSLFGDGRHLDSIGR